MATHSSILAWEIPWTEEPGGLRACNSVCLQCGRPGFDPWVGKIPWRRKWQPTPVLLPGKFHGPRSLVGYSPWGHKQLDTPERLHFLSVPGASNNTGYVYGCLVAKLCLTVTPWTIAPQAPLSMGFPRPEYWNGLPFPSPGGLLYPGIEPASPALAGGFFTH